MEQNLVQWNKMSYILYYFFYIKYTNQHNESES